MKWLTDVEIDRNVERICEMSNQPARVFSFHPKEHLIYFLLAIVKNCNLKKNLITFWWRLYVNTLNN